MHNKSLSPGLFNIGYICYKPLFLMPLRPNDIDKLPKARKEKPQIVESLEKTI